MLRLHQLHQWVLQEDRLDLQGRLAHQRDRLGLDFQLHQLHQLHLHR